MKKLYYRDKCKSLTIREGKLRSIDEIKKILGKKDFRDSGFDVPIRGKLTPRQAVALNKAEEELPSSFDVARVDDIELQEIMEHVARSIENLIVQLEGESCEDLPMHA